MESKSKIKRKKLLTIIVLTLFLLSATAISIASASPEPDPTQIPDQTTTDGSSGLTSENPTLYEAQDNTTTATDENPTLGRNPDNSTASADDDSTLYDSQNSESSDNPNLIATQSQPDYLVIIIAMIVGVAAIAGLAIIFSQRHTKNSK
jgi:flagellar basal body-associated protein FliL